MFDSIDDWLIVAVVAGVLFYGSTKIPQLAHSIGRATGEFKKGRIEVEKEIRGEQTATAPGSPSTPGAAPAVAASAVPSTGPAR